jgi:membrane protein
VFHNWSEDNCFRHAAALSYYTLFSLAPLVVIVIASAGYFFGEEAIRGLIFSKVHTIIGDDGAEGLQTLVKNAYISKPDSLSGLLSILILFFSATVVLVSLQGSLNVIFKVKPKPEKGILAFLIGRLLALLMVVIIGGLLVLSIIVNTILLSLGHYLSDILSNKVLVLIQWVQVLGSFGITTMLFAFIFKFLPDAKVSWRLSFIGAFFTAFFFMVGRSMISLYLSQINIVSLYGAAGSIIFLIVWINYSAWIFFMGAEIIFAYAQASGEKILPARYADSFRRVVEKIPGK